MIINHLLLCSEAALGRSPLVNLFTFESKAPLGIFHSKAVKIPLKHPNQKRLEEALEKMKKNKKVPKQKKDITLPSSHRKVSKDEPKKGK